MKKSIDELAAESRREYYRKWRAANKEKVKLQNANYWRRQAEKKLLENAKEGEAENGK